MGHPPHPNSAGSDVAFIDIGVDRVEDLFDPLDPAPLSDRDIDPTIVSYITNKVLRVEPKREIAIRVFLPSPSPETSALVTNSFRQHVMRASRDARLERKDHIRDGLRMLVISIIFALVLVLVMDIIAELSGIGFLDRVSKALSIVIWVILKRPTEILIFDLRPHRERIQVISRLQSAEAVCLSRSPASSRAAPPGGTEPGPN